MKKLKEYYKQVLQFLEKLYYSETARNIRYRLDTALEKIDDKMDDLLEQQNPNKHRLKGTLQKSKNILFDHHDGFNLCGKSISTELSFQNVLLNGESGSYKTAGGIIRSILTVQGSQIIHDPSSEIYNKTSEALSLMGYRILRLDFSTPNQSLGYNPLERVHTLSDISNLATNLVQDSDKPNSFWSSKGIELLTVIISVVKNLEPKYQTMGNVCYILDLIQAQNRPELITELIVRNADIKILTKYTSIMNNSSATLSSIVSTAQTAVQVFDLDEGISQITSCDTIGDFSNFRSELTAVFIHSNTAKMHYYSKITSLFLNQYFEHFFKELPQENDLNVFFHLDETPVLEIKNLDVIASNIRKYRGCLMLVCQNAESQLKSKYGQTAGAILSNLRTKVYYSSDLATAKMLVEIIGKYDYIDKQDNDRMKIKNVMSVDEIVSLPQDKVLIHISGVRPILAIVKPYFHFPKLNELCNLPPYDFTKNAEFQEPEYIDLEKMFPNIKPENEK